VKNEKHELSHADASSRISTSSLPRVRKSQCNEQIFLADKDEDKTRVELVLRWTEAADEQIRSYVNGIRTACRRHARGRASRSGS